MTVSQIANHFAGIGKIPVEIEDVLKLVCELCPDDEIGLKGVDKPPHPQRAFLRAYKRPPPEGAATMPTKCFEVIYSIHLTDDWKRLVCCKELVHVLDPDPVCTTTQEQVVHLVQKISTKATIATPPVGPNNLAHFVDELAKLQAMAILFPYGFYKEVFPLYQQKKITSAEVAQMVCLPVAHVEVVLQPIWEHIHNSVLAYN